MALSDLFEAMRGQEIPGGCEDCDAYQTTTNRDGIYHLMVHHDGTCPTLRQMQARH